MKRSSPGRGAVDHMLIFIRPEAVVVRYGGQPHPPSHPAEKQRATPHSFSRPESRGEQSEPTPRQHGMSLTIFLLLG